MVLVIKMDIIILRRNRTTINSNHNHNCHNLRCKITMDHQSMLIITAHIHMAAWQSKENTKFMVGVQLDLHIFLLIWLVRTEMVIMQVNKCHPHNHLTWVLIICQVAVTIKVNTVAVNIFNVHRSMTVRFHDFMKHSLKNGLSEIITQSL